MLLRMASFQSSSCTSNIPLAIHSPLDGRLGCFLVLAILNSAAMNFGVLFSFWVPFFSGYVPRSRIAGSYDNSIFSFLRNFHTLLLSGFTSLYTYQQCRTVKQMLIFKNFLGSRRFIGRVKLNTTAKTGYQGISLALMFIYSLTSQHLILFWWERGSDNLRPRKMVLRLVHL